MLHGHILMVMSQITENLSNSSLSDAPNKLETYTFIYIGECSPRYETLFCVLVPVIISV